MKDYLYSIEINVAGKQYSMVQFKFYNIKKSLTELKNEEVRTVSFCRSLLDDLFPIIRIISHTQLDEINKLVIPKITYGESYDKTIRFLEVTFSLGSIFREADSFKMFGCHLVLRTIDSLHVIDHGRFDLEFQALQQHKKYVNALEGISNNRIKSEIDQYFIKASECLKSIIEKTLGQKISAIGLSKVKPVEYSQMEGDNVLAAEGIILGSSFADNISSK
jgi:hypothetical protein